MKQTNFDVAIVGGGPGGYTAALYCARAGYSTLVLEKLSPGGQMATTGWVENYPGFEDGVDGFDLGEKMKLGADHAGATSVFETVTQLELADKVKVLHTTGGTYTAKTVIIATGASPKKLGLPEEDALVGSGVAYCATCDGALYKGKDVVVVGGGNSAAAEALFLSKLCGHVYLVHRRDKLRASNSYLNPLKSAKNITFVWDSQVQKVLHETTVTGVQVQNLKSGKTKKIDCQGVFVAIGRTPDTDLVAGQLTLDDHSYITAGENTKTSLPGVFAVGDVRTKTLRQIVTATADGAVASHYIEEFLSLEAN